MRRVSVVCYPLAEPGILPLPLFTHILAPTDFSTHASHALSYAVGLARDCGANLTIVHAVESWGDRVRGHPSQELDDTVREHIREQALSGLEEFDTDGIGAVHVESAAGRASLVITETAGRLGCDLIVLGTHGTSALEHALLGSTSEEVMRTAACPVFTIRFPEHKVVLPYIGG